MTRKHKKLRERLRHLTAHRLPGTYDTIRELAISGGPEAVLALYPTLPPQLIQDLIPRWREQRAIGQAKISTPTPQ